LCSITALASYKSTDTVLNNEGSYYVIGSIYNGFLTDWKNTKEGNKIYEVNTVKKNAKVIYQTNIKLSRLELSPDNKYIAVLKGYTGWLDKESELTIIDIEEKKEILSFKDAIGKYRWSPDSKKIIYITGGRIESLGFHSTGVWIYDLETKEKKKIAEKAKKVEWLTNGDIYIIDYYKKYGKDLEPDKIIYKSFVYREQNGSISKKGFKGVRISLDARYAITLDPEYIGFMPMTDRDYQKILIDFYDVAANKKIPRDRLSNIFKEPDRIQWDSIFWVRNNRVVIEKTIYGKLIRDILICDIRNNSVVKSIKGRVVGVNTDRSKIVVFFNGKFEIVDVP